jgi:hypothetical protein
VVCTGTWRPEACGLRSVFSTAGAAAAPPTEPLYATLCRARWGESSAKQQARSTRAGVGQHQHLPPAQGRRRGGVLLWPLATPLWLMGAKTKYRVRNRYTFFGTFFATKMAIEYRKRLLRGQRPLRSLRLPRFFREPLSHRPRSTRAKRFGPARFLFLSGGGRRFS